MARSDRTLQFGNRSRAVGTARDHRQIRAEAVEKLKTSCRAYMLQESEGTSITSRLLQCQRGVRERTSTSGRHRRGDCRGDDDDADAD